MTIVSVKSATTTVSSKWKLRSFWIAAPVALLLLLPIALRLLPQPNFTNGSFEAAFSGWTVSDLVNRATNDPVRPASDGSTAVVFNQDDHATIGASVSQTFSTAPGQRYGLSFDFGTVGAVADQVLEVTVTGEGLILDDTIRVAGLNGEPFYVPHHLSFVANSSATTLAFTDRSDTYVVIDALLDNVRIVAEGSQLPVVTSPPARIAVSKGHTATFEVRASGPGPLSYRWQFNGNDIPGATSSSYTVMPADTSQAGNYAVVVTNAAGSITSSAATLTVLPPGILLNGSFEYGSAGWTFSVPGGGAAGVSTNPRYGFTEGRQLVHFNYGQRDPTGAVSQTFATVPGSRYTLSFDVGAFSLVNQDEQGMHVTVRGNTDLVSHDVVVSAPGTGGRYEPQALTFVADSTATTVVFQDASRITKNVDLLLDNVRVTSGEPLGRIE